MSEAQDKLEEILTERIQDSEEFRAEYGEAEGAKTEFDKALSYNQERHAEDVEFKLTDRISALAEEWELDEDLVRDLWKEQNEVAQDES